MSGNNAYSCHSPWGTSSTWFPCPATTGTTTTTTTTTSPSSTTTTTTTTPTATSTTTTTTQSSNTISSSRSPTKPDGLPSDTSTGVKQTSTAVPNPDSSVTSSLPASSQTATPLHQHASLSPGATAGIAVGCAAAGLIIGLLAALLLFRRRKGKDVADISRAPILVKSKEPPSAEIDGIGPIAGIQLGQFLLDGAPDQEIVSELQALSELIHQHVEDYYTLQPVDVSVGTLSQSLQNLGLGSSGLGLTAEAIATICINSHSRHIGLRYVISRVIFASIDFHTRSGLSMLPGPAAGFLQSIPGAEYGGNNNLGM